MNQLHLHTTTDLRPLYSQPALVGTSSQELEDFVGAKFYCQSTSMPLLTATSHIRIREKTLKFASTVLPTLSA